MTGPLVETKLFIPVPRPRALPRARLGERLTRRGGHVNLIAAPAGFGKTTLLAAALAHWPRGGATEATDDNSNSDSSDNSGGDPPDQGWAVAWVAVDDGDRDPATFW